MVSLVLGIIGTIGLLHNGNYTSAGVVVLAMIVAYNLEEDSIGRWAISTAVLVLGLGTLFSFSFLVGLVVTVACILLALTPSRVG